MKCMIISGFCYFQLPSAMQNWKDFFVRIVEWNMSFSEKEKIYFIIYVFVWNSISVSFCSDTSNMLIWLTFTNALAVYTYFSCITNISNCILLSSTSTYGIPMQTYGLFSFSLFLPTEFHHFRSDGVCVSLWAFIISDSFFISITKSRFRLFFTSVDFDEGNNACMCGGNVESKLFCFFHCNLSEFKTSFQICACANIFFEQLSHKRLYY